MSKREKESYNWLDDPFDEKKAAAERERMNAGGSFPKVGCALAIVIVLVIAMFAMGAATLGALASAL